MSAIAFAIEALNVLPGLISSGIDVIDLINKTSADLKKMQDENRDPTDSEWEALNKIVEDLRTQRPDVTEELD